MGRPPRTLTDGTAEAASFSASSRSGATLLDLEKRSPLPFSLTLTDGRIIETVGDAADFLSTLSADQRERAHWKMAILMLNNAMKEARYLATAAMNLRSAMVLDRLLEP
jgi:hypothetical protein